MRSINLQLAGVRGGSAIKHKWTDEERDIVRRDYNGTNASALRIAYKLGITWCAVKGQVQGLGLAKDKSRRWTPKEEELLSELITRYRPSAIARRLKRSINSVVVKSKRLGCSRRAKDGWFTKKDICEMLGVDHKWIQRRIDDGELKAEWNNPDVKPSQNGGSYWRIKECDLREYVINHAFELMGRNIDLFTVVQVLVEV